MTQAQHRAAVKVALRSDKGLERVFALLGSKAHPNGALLRAYRNARRGMASAYRGPRWNRYAATSEVLGGLRIEAGRAIDTALRSAEQLGREQGQATNSIYDRPQTPGLYTALAPAVAAVLAIVLSQIQAAQAAVSAEMEPELIFGSGDTAGILNPTPVIREGNKWAGVLAIGAWAATVGGTDRRPEPVYDKQAIAAIDERTTECCLMAHGQVVGFEENFQLDGEPRYADELEWTPFHWNCRSSIAMVRREDAEDDLTQEMRDAAAAELEAREDGSRQEIHPASATSRR